MLNLEINDVNLAIRSLHAKLKTKDIQLYENTREAKKSGTTDPKEPSTSTTKICLNCKYSSKPEHQHVHSIWSCREIDY